MDSKSEIILYQPDNEVRLEVRLEDETVWLTQAQMAELFQTTSQNITIHIRSIYSENELGSEATCKDSLQVRREGNRVVRRKQNNYVDESVLLMLSKRGEAVGADIYTQSISRQLQLDLERHNSQYPPIGIHTCRRSHDRFLIVDNSVVYHIGASLKDLGKKMFAFSKMGIPAEEILAKL